MTVDTVKVLYIAGCGRSGSTLLDRMLGQIHGFFSVGELWYIWERGFMENQLCGCGRPFKECRFWSAVFEEAFGGFDCVDIEKIKALRLSVARKRYIPGLMFPVKTPRYRENLKLYSRILSRLYSAIKKVSGAAVIVDSSKYPLYGFVLNEVPDVGIYVVHLVRDSRAVAFSCLRKKQKPEVYRKREYMPIQGPIKTAMSWNFNNFLCRRLGSARGFQYPLIRYEDLMKDPEEELKRIIRFVGEEAPVKLNFIQEGKIHLKEAHTVSGNPMRFKTGWLPLHFDNEWRKSISPTHNFLVTMLTFPDLRRYGYLQKEPG